MGTYKGASPGKNEVRSFGYDQIHPKEILSKYHITTAGACGDVIELLKRGSPSRHILVADLKREPIEQAARLGCQAHLCSIQELVRMTLEGGAQNLISVNVDLCETPQKGLPILNEILRDLKEYKWSGYIMYTCTWSWGGQGCNDRKRFALLNTVYRHNKKKIVFSIEHLRRYKGTKGMPMAFIMMYVRNGHITAINTRKGIRTMTTAAANKAWKTRRANATTTTAAKKAAKPAKVKTKPAKKTAAKGKKKK